MYVENKLLYLHMGKRKITFTAIWELYRDGFKNMTWGRQLWWLILLKVIILFAVLRLFFFKPAMAGLTDEQKSEQVGNHLCNPDKLEQKDTINLIKD